MTVIRTAWCITFRYNLLHCRLSPWLTFIILILWPLRNMQHIHWIFTVSSSLNCAESVSLSPLQNHKCYSDNIAKKMLTSGQQPPQVSLSETMEHNGYLHGSICFKAWITIFFFSRAKPIGAIDFHWSAMVISACLIYSNSHSFIPKYIYLCCGSWWNGRKMEGEWPR